MDVKMLPIGTIDTGAMTRDRIGLDRNAMDELKWSISGSGVRMPLEVYRLETPRGEEVWGLISGYRRLYAMRELFEVTGQARYSEIPALVRPRESEAATMAAMVAENTMRAGLSAWERGQIAVAARDAGAFPTIEAAVEGLYQGAKRAKRGRMRALAQLAEEMAGTLPAPEKLSERRALLLAAAVQAGHGPLLRAELSGVSAARQWPVLAEVLGDIARADADAAAAAVPGQRDDASRVGGSRRSGIARRRTVGQLKGRREALPAGWALTVTGPEATEAMALAIMGRLRWLYGPPPPRAQPSGAV